MVTFDPLSPKNIVLKVDSDRSYVRIEFEKVEKVSRSAFCANPPPKSLLREILALSLSKNPWSSG